MFLAIIFISAAAAAAYGRTSVAELEGRIGRYIADKDARIGVAVIIDGRDTAEVNGCHFFRCSVYINFRRRLQWPSIAAGMA